MHTVMWTYKLPAGTSKGQLIETINATAHNYEGIPGLIRKYYGITPDGCSLVGIYLWESVAAANAFHTADWVAMALRSWQASASVKAAQVFGPGDQFLRFWRRIT